jgi:hypothetical protein
MKDFLSIKEKILSLRVFGVTHCFLESRTNNNAKKSLLEFGKKIGFTIEDDTLQEIERGQALDILKLVLKQDLYSEIMPEEQAEELARDFCDLFQKDAKFFTYASIGEIYSDKTALSTCTPITKATLDDGVFIVDKKSVGCLWVEDED